MTSIATLGELMQQSDAHYRIFDLGRRVQSISNTVFSRIEEATIPYPYPLQRHAWFAVLFWHKEAISSPFLWFIKLPLDEQGLLIQTARNHYLSIVLDALGQQLLSDNLDQEQEKRLQQNPYHFTPHANKLAMLNSKIRYTLHQAPSEFYQPALDYLRRSNAQSEWQEIGVQGLHDIAVRIEDEEIAKVVTDSLSWLPQEVLLPLMTALEQSRPNTNMSVVLASMIDKAIEQKDNDILLALLRGMSHSNATEIKQTVLNQYLNSTAVSVDGLQLIAARSWEFLQDQSQMLTYMEALAAKDADVEEPVFISIMLDLLYLPATKSVALSCLRSPSRSQTLSTAIGQLFGQLSS